MISKSVKRRLAIQKKPSEILDKLRQGIPDIDQALSDLRKWVLGKKRDDRERISNMYYNQALEDLAKDI